MKATVKRLPWALGAMFACLAYANAAQDNVSTLSNFRQTGNGTPLETIPQTGRTADALSKNLEQIKLPPGFKIDLYAVVPEARHMAIEPSTGVVFVGTRKNRVWQVTDRTHQRVASDVVQFASSVTFKVPNGVLLAGRRALRRRAEPRPWLPGGAVLRRRRARCGRDGRSPAGQAGPGAVRKLQSRRARAASGRTRSFTSHLASRGTCRRRTSSPNSTVMVMGSPASSAWIRTARIAKSMRTACAIRSASTSIRRTGRCGSRMTRSTAWVTTPRLAS